MDSEQFRQQLRQEIEQWQAEGLINQELYETLASRYQFSDLERSARNNFVMILLGLGSILMGLAAITFVSANWQVWSPEIKLFLLIVIFLVVTISGVYLWLRGLDGWQYRLSNGLLLLGALLFGANIALISQVYGFNLPVYQLYTFWAIGVLLMAYSLRLTMLGILSIILIGIAYVSSIGYLFVADKFSWLLLPLQHTPIFVIIFFLPLAYWCRSSWLFSLTTIAFIAGLSGNLLLVQEDFYRFSPLLGGLIMAIAYCLPPALLWVYGELFYIKGLADTSAFWDIARSLSLLFLSVLFYLFSFNFFWHDFSASGVGHLSWQECLIVLDLIIMLGLTIWGWQQLLQERVNSDSMIVALMISVTALLVFWHIGIHSLGAIATWVCNVLLFILAVRLVRQALARGVRASFWGGMVLMILQLLSRMLEYDTDLLLKAIILFICGAVVIASGLWFERYLNTLSQ